MCAHTEKTTFSCKDDSRKALHVYWRGGEELVLDKAHTVLDIFHFAVFFKVTSSCKNKRMLSNQETAVWIFATKTTI